MKADASIRIIYMGTPDFAVPGLEILIKNNFNVVAVITAPDKPAGRGLKLQISPVKEAALKYGIPVLQPEKLKSPDFLEQLRSFQADLQIVVAFRMLPELVWNMPRLGTFNLHASLLPQYRGAAPINWAIINGASETGLTTFFLKQEIDTGDILLQEKEPILPEDNVGTLYERLMNKGARLILKTVLLVESGNYQPQAQIYSADLKSAPKIFKETCKIDWNLDAFSIHNLVRGLSPYPSAWAEINGDKFKIYTTKILPNQHLPLGTIHSDSKTYIHVQTATDCIAILELQPEGKRRMKVEDYLRGNKI
ncbi:MAG: methionyl-tRNA formyltransferase [Cytophagales bacterium]|nr:MAG: methionyl-tRNA formyltransferase [Cytophagales bacterium]